LIQLSFGVLLDKATNVIAVIPARGGSKGIPRKNIVPFAGKPLICYTIEAALRSRYLKRVIVSTDDADIAKVAKDCGAEVPFLRPPNLSQDDTPSVSVLKHAVNIIEESQGSLCNFVVLLQPTSPLRNEKYIDLTVEKMLETGADSVITVCEVRHHPFWTFVANEDRLHSLLPNCDKSSRRQELPQTYSPNGAVYLVKRGVLFNENTVFGKDLRGIIMPSEESIDIDDYYDLFLGEMTGKYWKEWLNEKRENRQ
jgi:CMP-N,N'-diacetyllegionaminic acid synthase